MDNYKKNKFNYVEHNFITKAHFTSLKHHFENVIESIKDDESLTRIMVEFTKLLHEFESTFEESERKSRKIHELRALGTVELQKVKSASSVKDAVMEDMKSTINNLQRDLDQSETQRRELLEEIEDLKESVNAQSKIIKVNKRTQTSDEDDRDENCQESEERNKEDPELKKDVRKVSFSRKRLLEQTALLKKKEEAAAVSLQLAPQVDVPKPEPEPETESDIEVLKNNLEILHLDLQLTRLRIHELKKELREKDVLVNKFSKDLSYSEAKLTEAQSNFLNFQKPMEDEIAQYKRELTNKMQKIDGITKELEKSQNRNAKLSRDLSLKELIIHDMVTKLKELDNEKECAIRRADMFEKNLGKSNNHVAILKCEIETLREEVGSLKEQISNKQSKESTDKIAVPVNETDDEVRTLEETIEKMRNNIIRGDQRLRQVGAELSTTVEVLHSIRKDFDAVCKEKHILESEVKEMKNKLNEKNLDMKQLKAKFDDDIKEIEEIKRELLSQIKKNQQAVDKRNKMQTLYNHMKFVNSQQKKENKILGKRQEYLVKILKEKDMEIERVVTWKRYIWSAES